MSLMVLLAGKDTDFLPNTYILRLDTSDIKPSNLNLDLDSLVSSLPFSPEDLPEGYTDDLPDDVIDELAQTAAKLLGLKDFYDSHIMNYCSGVETTDGDSEITYCSPVHGLYAFDPVAILETELIAGVSITDLGIPSQVEDGAKALAVAYKAMFICYVVGIALSGLCVLLSLTIGWLESRAVAGIAGILSILAALALGVGAAIATAIAVILKDVINKNMGDRLNVWAKNDGGKFMGLSWAAVFAMFVAMIYWGIGCCCCSGSAARRRKEKREQEQMMSEVHA